MKQRKSLAIIGGMSHESSVYSNQLVYDLFRKKTGGSSCPQMITYELDMNQVECLQKAGDSDGLSDLIYEAGMRLGQNGFEADIAILCSNTMHEYADFLLPFMEFIDIRDVTAQAIIAQDMHKVALLGTRYTMEKDFYRQRLEKFGLDIMIPDVGDRELIQHIIYQELIKGVISKDSEKHLQLIIENLKEQGAEGAILGCTELPLLIKESCIPIFDTTYLQAQAAVEAMF